MKTKLFILCIGLLSLSACESTQGSLQNILNDRASNAGARAGY